MRRDWWIRVIQWSIWGIVMAIVMGWVARLRLQKRPVSEQRILRHPTSTLLIGMVGVVFFYGIAIIANTIGKNATSTIWTTLAFVGFGTAFLPVIADYFFAKHHVDDDGIEYGRTFGQRGVAKWSDVRRVSFAPIMKWFALDLYSGARVRISAMLMGLPEFARCVLLHVPRENIDATARLILEETQSGRPPSLWG